MKKIVLGLVVIAALLAFFFGRCDSRKNIVASSSYGPFSKRGEVMIREKGDSSFCSYICEFYAQSGAKPAVTEWSQPNFVPQSVNVRMESPNDATVFIDGTVACILKQGRWVATIHSGQK